MSFAELTGLEATPAKNSPGEMDDVAYPDLFQDIGGLHYPGNPGEQFVIGRRVL